MAKELDAGALHPVSAHQPTDTIAPKGSFYIPSLDGIRAISFFIVFVAHAGFGEVIPGGFGVTIFFVLSGFLITTLLRMEFARHGDIRLGSFYLRRVFRILPPLYLAILFGCVLAHFDTVQPGVPFLGTLMQCLQVSNYHQIFDAPAIMLPGSGVLWSLAVEEHFYLIFPIVYLWMCRHLPVRRQVILLLSLCAVVLAWRYVLRYAFHASDLRTFMATDTRFDSILLGSVFAIIANPTLRDPMSNWIIERMKWILPVAFALLASTLLLRDDNFRETLRYTLQGLALLPIFIAAIHYQKSPVVRFLNLPTVRFLGVLSYVLYLCHFMILVRVGESIHVNLYLQAVISFALALVFASAVHYGVERPLGRIRKKLSEASN
jgi:peptidoglycan/LPS O-acetylase OafA/YrhL